MRLYDIFQCFGHLFIRQWVWLLRQLTTLFTIHKGLFMLNISSIYPNKEGSRFDFDYYLNVHMPMSIECLSGAKGFRGVSVERGVSVDNPKIESSFVAMCHYYFDSVEYFLRAFEPHAQTLQADITNYTDIEPIIQINEVEIRK